MTFRVAFNPVTGAFQARRIRALLKKSQYNVDGQSYAAISGRFALYSGAWHAQR